jgi:hypothetical protein
MLTKDIAETGHIPLQETGCNVKILDSESQVVFVCYLKLYQYLTVEKTA